jgi:hypothetical protein
MAAFATWIQVWVVCLARRFPTDGSGLFPQALTGTSGQVLYFLRAFELMGGLVRMVFKVFYYTGPFMMILLVVLLATANCFYILFRCAGFPWNDSAPLAGPCVRSCGVVGIATLPTTVP